MDCNPYAAGLCLEQEVTVSQINLVTKVFVDNQSHNNLVTPTPVPCSQSMFSSSIKWAAASVVGTGPGHQNWPQTSDCPEIADPHIVTWTPDTHHNTQTDGMTRHFEWIKSYNFTFKVKNK